MIGTPTAIYPTREYKKPSNMQLTQLGRWNSIRELDTLLKRMPPQVVIAASEYGFIGSESPDTKIVDLVGLPDRTIVSNGFSVEYILAQKPDIIWLPHQDYTGAITEILDSDGCALDYNYYPGVYDYGSALCRTSLLFKSVQEITEEEFARLYPGLRMSDYRALPGELSDKA